NQNQEEHEGEAESRPAAQAAGSGELSPPVGTEHRDASALQDSTQPHRAQNHQDQEEQKTGHGQASSRSPSVPKGPTISRGGPPVISRRRRVECLLAESWCPGNLPRTGR